MLKHYSESDLGFHSFQTIKLTELEEFSKDQEEKFFNYVSGMYSFYYIFP